MHHQSKNHRRKEENGSPAVERAKHSRAGSAAGRTNLSVLSRTFVEHLYARFLADPKSVPADWRAFLQELAREEDEPRQAALGPTFARRSVFNPSPVAQHDGRPARLSHLTVLQERVDQLVRNYRVRGHRIAKIDPLGRPRPSPPELELEFCGLSEADLDRPFSVSTRAGSAANTLGEILQRLRNTYCRSIGVQFMHIDDLSVRQWLQERMEGCENRIALSREQQFRILRRMTDAVVFEEFIQKKYLGAKSFSLEGAETLIPLLELVIERAGDHGVREIVIAMAHRGRLNVLVNIMGKKPRQIFREFEGVDPQLHLGRGDVKYHLGHSNDWRTESGREIHLSLCFNPSHLEFVNPVALGRMRAKQDRFEDGRRRKGMALLVHGDASFAGEGIVQETLNLSQLAAYTTGGTIHVIVNNQIGFTTGPEQARSSGYATDVAKMLQIPIFHVNGEDPEAAAQVVRLAMDFRRAFQRDVVIDMYCYRRHGHNEGDDPSFTQPLMYHAIEDITPPHEKYLQRLLRLGDITRDQAEQLAEGTREHLDHELELARSESGPSTAQSLQGAWAGYRGGHAEEGDEIETGVEPERLVRLLERLARVPDGFHAHPKIERFLKSRAAMAQGDEPLDWATAEALALASLATEGGRVRLSGQDTARGTFSQRHAVLHDVEDGHTYVPLQNLAQDQAPVEILNSPLSEVGALGYEYGYSLDCPEGLVLWEAQFGDFCNAAQVIIDQFIVSAEDKWQRLSGIVLLLPHGFEGQGPEHSSARLERFLMLAGEDNIQVAYPTTPAQYFHLLRRQVLRRWRKPLVVMTPKSLLRHPEAVSGLEGCGEGRFQRVIPDTYETPHERVKHLLLCSGKIYYELLKHRGVLDRDDVAIVRVEQLYPLPTEPLRDALAAYPDGTPAVWVQEEPENMGAWPFLRLQFGNALFGRLPFSGIARHASASPATGSATSHRLEQEQLLSKAFGGVEEYE